MSLHKPVWLSTLLAELDRLQENRARPVVDVIHADRTIGTARYLALYPIIGEPGVQAGNRCIVVEAEKAVSGVTVVKLYYSEAPDKKTTCVPYAALPEHVGEGKMRHFYEMADDAMIFLLSGRYPDESFWKKIH